MPVVSDDILKCARTIAALPGLNEAGIRATVGRAYYSAFHECRAWHAKLAEPGRLPVGFVGGDHLELSTRLINPGQSITGALREASIKRGVRLRALHGERCKADYDLSETLDAADASAALNEVMGIKNTVVV